MMMMMMWSMIMTLSFSLGWPLICFSLTFLLLMMMKLFPLYYDYQFIFVFLDQLSFSLSSLSIFISLLVILSMTGYFNKSPELLLLMINLLLLFLLGSFFSFNCLLFYFFFECSLIPTFLIILGWGSQPERIQASVYFMFYTLVASIPLLVTLMYLSSSLKGLSFFSISFFQFEKNLASFLISIFLFLAFFIKLPIFIFHLWLPKAHVEAPVGGSMILAGVLLKLGGYGIMRMMMFSPGLMACLSPLVVSVSIVGLFFVGLTCCRSSDLKALVAYSSVSHMGVMLSGLVTYFNCGAYGGLLMMVGHGLNSSALFCVINMYYERTSSRSLYVNSGLSSLFPIFSLVVFILCAFNISSPPSMNLFAEIFLIYNLLGFTYYMMPMFLIGSFVGAVFSFHLFSFSQHGKLYSSLLSINPMNSREFHLMSLHIFPMILLTFSFPLLFL